MNPTESQQSPTTWRGLARLDWRAAVVSLVITLTIGAVLSFVLGDMVAATARSEVERDVLEATERLLNGALTADDLAVPMTGARYDAFRAAVDELARSERLLRVRLLDSLGRVVYSDDPAEVGRPIDGAAPRLQTALAGRLSTQIEAVYSSSGGQPPERTDEHDQESGHAHTGSTAGGESPQVVLKVYAPLIFPGATGSLGALETDHDYTLIQADTARLQRAVTYGLGVALTVAYLALMVFVQRGWNVIRGQQLLLRQQTEVLVRSNADLQASETQLRALVLNAFDVILVTDSLGLIAYASPSAARAWGVSPWALLGTSVYDLMEPAHAVETRTKLKQLAAAVGASTTVDFAVVTAANRREVQAAVTNLLSEPSVAGLVFNCRDVTEQRRSEEWFRSLVVRSSDVIWVLDGERRVTYVSPSVSRILGLEPRSLIGTLFVDKVPLSDRARMERALQHPATEDAGVEHGLNELQPDRVLESRVADLTDVPAVQGLVVSTRDVTDRKALEANVERALELDRLKTEFVGLASHELRTPLTGIYGFSELLASSTDLPDAEHAWADAIHVEASRLQSIIDALLSVSKIEAGAFTARLEPAPLRACVEKAVQFVATDGTPHELVVEVHEDLMVWADRSRLIEVFENLVGNAVKYSPQGGVIRITAVANGAEIRASVSDQGMGIPTAAIGTLFERFKRIDTPDRAQIRGTGLGLYLVKQYVDSFGGCMEVLSTLGEGSTFTVVLKGADKTIVAAAA